MIKRKLGIVGEYFIQAHQEDADGNEVSGTRRILADWFPNLITDGGLDMVAGTGYLNYCQVGSGNREPKFSDSSLQSRIATSRGEVNAGEPSSDGPYYSTAIVTYKFRQGAAAGNISEIGVSKDENGNLFSRALILDGLGQPTTITVLPIEVLTVKYRLRIYFDPDDVASQFLIDGVQYQSVSRLANASDLRNLALFMARDGIHHKSNSIIRFYSGDLGAVTGLPSNQITNSYIHSVNAPYSSGSHYLDMSITVGPESGNIPGGIKSLAIVGETINTQHSFDPPLPKDNTKTMTISYRISWARHTP